MGNQENFKEHIKNAIRLYNSGGLSQVFAKVVNGELISNGKNQKAEEFLNAFKRRTTSAIENSGEYTFTNEESSENMTISYSLTESENVLISRLKEMSINIPTIESLVSTLSESELVKQAQGFLYGGTPIDGQNKEVIEQSLNMLALIHSEYTKSAGKKKSPTSESAVLESIIKKVLRQSEDFSAIDFSKDSPLIQYLDEMVAVAKSQSELGKHKEMFEFRCGAVDVLNGLRQGFAQYIFDRENIVHTINSRDNILFKVDEDPSKTLAEMMADCADAVLDLTKKNGVTVKDLLTHQRKQIAEMESARSSLLAVDNGIVRLQNARDSYTERYNGFLELLPQRLNEISEAKGLSSVGGLVGREIEGNACDKIQNPESGEWEVVGKSEEEKIITDEDVISTLYNRVVLHESTIMSGYLNKLIGSEDSSEIERIISEYEQKFKVAGSQLEGDFLKVLQVYSDLLDYKMRIVRTPYESKRVVARYLSDFNPIIKKTGTPYFEGEQLEKIRTVGRKACMEALDSQKRYFNHLLIPFSLGIMDYIDEMPVREVGQPVDGLISAEGIMKATKTFDLQSHEKSIHDILKDSDFVISYLQAPKTAQKDLMEVLSDERIETKLNGVVPMLAFEVGYRVLENWLQLTYGIGKSDKTSKNLSAYDKFIKLDTICGKAFYQSDAFYYHLASTMPRVELYKKQEQARLREQSFRRMGERALKDKRITDLLDAFDAYYIGWLHNLHVMEQDRIEKGEELAVANRDVERENRTIARGETHLRRFIGTDEAE